jgi:hypothetical protein
MVISEVFNVLVVCAEKISEKLANWAIGQMGEILTQCRSW